LTPPVNGSAGGVGVRAGTPISAFCFRSVVGGQ
jgi:hypothetical protein